MGLKFLIYAYQEYLKFSQRSRIFFEFKQIALYFSFLGFYTLFLIPAAIVGILVFIYGISVSQNAPDVKDSCSDPVGANGTESLFYMCPLCDKRYSLVLLGVRGILF